MEYFIPFLLLFGNFVLGDIAGEAKVVEPEEPPPIVVEENREIFTEEEIINYIEKYSDKYGVDSDLAMSIAWAESEYYYKAKNSESSAEGVFQMLDGTWEYTMRKMGLPISTSKTQIPVSIEAGIFLLSKEGTRHWEASRIRWIGKLAKLKE